MNWPSEGSFPSAAPSSSSDDNHPWTFPVSSNPFHVTSASPSQPINPGLGISYGELNTSFNYLGQCPPPEPCTAPWAAQLLPSALPSLNTSQMSPSTFYDGYTGSDASASPPSYCGPPEMSATSSRGSVLDYRAGRDASAYSLWPITPHSDAEIIMKEEADTDLQERPPYELTKPVSMPLFAPVAQHATNGLWPKLECPEEDDTSELTVLDHDGEYSVSVEPPTFTDEMSPPWASENYTLHDHRQLRVPSAGGRECTICGARFTRPSNCREHMKKHDPNNRKAFACSDCGKTLGRKTDLKRHVDSVSVPWPL
ncbi:hypothetical protein BDV18DRAFT_119898 [Aspergillus unguis]